MARTESALTTRGVELIQQGRPLRTVAALLGLAPSTLVRACQRAGVVAVEHQQVDIGVGAGAHRVAAAVGHHAVADLDREPQDALLGVLRDRLRGRQALRLCLENYVGEA